MKSFEDVHMSGQNLTTASLFYFISNPEFIHFLQS